MDEIMDVLKVMGFEIDSPAFMERPSETLLAAHRAGTITWAEAESLYLCFCPVKYGWAS